MGRNRSSSASSLSSSRSSTSSKTRHYKSSKSSKRRRSSSSESLSSRSSRRHKDKGSRYNNRRSRSRSSSSSRRRRHSSSNKDHDSSSRRRRRRSSSRSHSRRKHSPKKHSSSSSNKYDSSKTKNKRSNSNSSRSSSSSTNSSSESKRKTTSSSSTKQTKSRLIDLNMEREKNYEFADGINDLFKNEQQTRRKIDIENDGFKPQSFKSSRSTTNKNNTKLSREQEHENAIFGIINPATTTITTATTAPLATQSESNPKPNQLLDNSQDELKPVISLFTGPIELNVVNASSKQLMHENLFEDVLVKEKRWLKKMLDLMTNRSNSTVAT